MALNIPLEALKLNYDFKHLIVSYYFLKDQKKGRFKCPVCSGKLRKLKGKNVWICQNKNCPLVGIESLQNGLRLLFDSTWRYRLQQKRSEETRPPITLQKEVSRSYRARAT
ncbi:MAG: hypothetical protein QW660_08745 [Candidatus Bathyarchaeia archaeon]